MELPAPTMIPPHTPGSLHDAYACIMLSVLLPAVKVFHSHLFQQFFLILSTLTCIVIYIINLMRLLFFNYSELSEFRMTWY